MRLDDAVEMLAPSGLTRLGPMTWADLGCGDGTFTRALATLLAAGSVVHAMDQDRAALRRVPAMEGQTRIERHLGDFTRQPWPFPGPFPGPSQRLDGMLMANSLHYVRDQAAFLSSCRPHLAPPFRILIVEYDADVANPYVPYPVSRRRLRELCPTSIVTELSTRPSRYQRAALYAALVSAE